MSKYWKIFIGCIVGLLVVVFLLLMYLLEKPEPTVDYFTQYNDLTRPDSYDPKQDAAEVLKNLPPDFGGIMSGLISGEEKDEQFSTYDFEIADYPQKFTPEDLQKLEKWLAKNQAKLDMIVEASGKPYYYRPVDAAQWRDSTLQDYSVYSDVSSNFYTLTEMLSWATVYHLHKGDSQAASRYVQTFLDMYRIIRPHAGQYQQYEVASYIDSLHFLTGCLQHQEFSSEALKAVQELLLAAELDCRYDDTVARLCFYDYVQKYYTPGDHGHLSPITYIKKEMYMFDWNAVGDGLRCVYEAFNGERRKKIVERMESIFARVGELKDLSISRQFAEGIDLQNELDALAGDNDVLQMQAGSLLNQFRLPYQSACTVQALAALIAIERFHRDRGQYPESLEVLLSEGFIDRLPADSFSGKPLVYRRQTEGFILYSVGIDGQDDGGYPAICRNCGNHLTDWGDGPVFRPGSPVTVDPADPKDAYADHIFWPMMEMDRSTGQLAPSDIFPKI
jgi:hypothetical protein